MAPHGSVDWERNDCLGRNTGQLPLFEHRRQILRAIANGDAYSDTNSYSNSNAHFYGFPYGYPNPYCHA